VTTDPRIDQAVLILAWILVWGTITALIGPRKGWTPLGAFGIGAIFGFLAVIFLALKPDRKD
jgi:hypothetical protein